MLLKLYGLIFVQNNIYYFVSSKKKKIVMMYSCYRPLYPVLKINSSHWRGIKGLTGTWMTVSSCYNS